MTVDGNMWYLLPFLLPYVPYSPDLGPPPSLRGESGSLTMRQSYESDFSYKKLSQFPIT